MTHVTCSLMGGLGNLLFQLCSTYSISKKNRYTFYFDKNRWIRAYHSHVDYFACIFEKWKSYNIPLEPNAIVHEHNLHPIGDITPNTNTLIWGYLQNWEYIWDYREELIGMLQFNPEVASKYSRLHDSAFLHVRGGDYVNHGFHDVGLSKVYYPKAIETVEAPHYYVCTNDIPYLKQQPWLDAIHYTILGENEIDTLYLMSQCKLGGICANSSFSWWGAFLDPNRPIYMPSKWFNDSQLYTKGFYFPGVTVIETS